MQRFGCELLFAEDVHGGGKVRTADRVVPMTVAGRLLHAQQEQGSALRIEAKAINAVHCGVAVPAQLVSALLAPMRGPIGESTGDTGQADVRSQ